MGKIIKEYVHYQDRKTYAIYYKGNNTIYYNLDCEKDAKLIKTKMRIGGLKHAKTN